VPRLALVLLALLVSNAGATARLPVQAELRVTDLHSGRAILPSGTLISTGDGFRHWGASYRLTVPLHDLAAVDRYVAFAVGTDGRLHRTVNGGKSWSTLANVPRLDRIVAADPAHVFATTSSGRLAASSDGGTEWRMLSPAGVQSICVSASRILVSGPGEILRSTDGGRSFARVFEVPLRRLARGTIELTCAHGGAWATLAGLGAGMSQEAYVLLESPDGGRTWVPRLAEQYFPYWHAVARDADGPPSAPVVAPTGPAGAVIAGGCPACGAGTTVVMITSEGGRTWRAPSGNSVPAVLDNAEPLAIDFLDERDGWLVVQPTAFGISPRILRTTDGGRTWAFLAEL
jgi:photosystem II stability/assembly factor-like uncharacterized protein